MSLLRTLRWDVFVSHAEEDSAAARDIVEHLQTAGLKCWFDKDRLRTGERFDEDIRQGLRQSAVLLLLLSRRATEKNYVAFETSQAFGLKLKLVPVFLEKFDTSQLRPPFSLVIQHQGPRLFEVSGPETRDRLASDLRQLSRWRRVPLAVWLTFALVAVALLAWGLTLLTRLQARTVVSLLKSGEPPIPAATQPWAKPALQWGLYGLPGNASSWVELEDGNSLRSGERYFLRALPSTPGFLYVWQLDSAGKVQWLFPQNPSFPDSSGKNPVAPSQEVLLPAIAEKAYVLDDTTGEEQFFVVFTVTAWPELEEALQAGKTGAVGLALSEAEQATVAARAKGSAGTVRVTIPKPPRTLFNRPIEYGSMGWEARQHYVLGYRRIQHLPPAPRP